MSPLTEILRLSLWLPGILFCVRVYDYTALCKLHGTNPNQSNRWPFVKKLTFTYVKKRKIERSCLFFSFYSRKLREPPISGYFFYSAHVIVQFLWVFKAHILANPLNVLFICDGDGVVGELLCGEGGECGKLDPFALGGG